MTGVAGGGAATRGWKCGWVMDGITTLGCSNQRGQKGANQGQRAPIMMS